MTEVSKHSSDFAIDAELLQEILHIFRRRGDLATGIKASEYLVDLFPMVIPVTVNEIKAAISLMPNHPRLAVRDAIHAAVVQLHGLEGIVSTDRAFDGIMGLVRYDPKMLVEGKR
jgi:predicted nucleic acid-binding protein